MPRIARVNTPWTVVHLISRFVDHRFDMDDQGRTAYLRRLGICLPRTDWSLLGFALMSSHIHLCALGGTQPLRNWIHPLHTWWAGWINARRRAAGQRSLGPVFADRPREIVVPPERTGRLLAYIHNNPVRAGAVTEADESDWTSHRFMVGKDTAPSYLDTGRALELAGFDDAPSGRIDFDRFVQGRIEAGADDRTEFEAVGPLQQTILPVREPGQRSAAHAIDDPLRVAADLCAQAGVHIDELTGPCRQRHIVNLRAEALLLWSETGRPVSLMADLLHISRAAAYQLLARRSGRKLTS